VAIGTSLEPYPVNVRIKISALWTSMLFIFAYVDLFSLYRPDFRAAVEAGEVGGFTVNQSFLVATTAYVVIPCLMVFGTLVTPPHLSRITNIAVGIVYSVTIIAGALGEWGYYVFGSLIEVALLAVVVYYAWTWPRRPETLEQNSTTH
jgi:Family of unknown function (DUF6326)